MDDLERAEFIGDEVGFKRGKALVTHGWIAHF